MLNDPGNPNLKLLSRQNVWLKSYGYFCALWEKKLTPQFPYMVTQERPAGKFSELHFSFS